LLVPVALFSAIPATALRGLPRDGSVAELIDALIQREFERGLKAHARESRRR
jgi:hypothetical protein